MFTALKKLTSKSDSQSHQNVLPETAGKTMSGSLQKKFSRGVQYNMKIIIKGDNNVGKTCLFQRLQGKSFIEQYTPSEQIQVTSIQWSFKATEDIVKVEVWDVVDRGKARQRNTGLKGIGKEQEQPVLDAEFLDVYKGTHGVILMMDITKSWTFDYVTREIDKIPKEMPVLILGNHCDMAHHRVITPAQVTGLIEDVSSNRSAEILYAESSMRNGFGLRLLHKFLGLPFLQLQKDTLKALIERNARDTDICIFEISEFLKSDDSDYSKFLDNLVNKRRQVADSNSSIISGSSSSSNINQQNTINSPTASISTAPIIPAQAPGISDYKFTKSIIVGGGKPIVIPGQTNITNDPKYRKQANSVNGANHSVAGPSSVNNTVGVADTVTNAKSSGLHDASKITKIEEFCPDGGIVLDKSFLDENGVISNANDYTLSTAVAVNDSDSENETGNPLVARFEEDDVLTNFNSNSYYSNTGSEKNMLTQNPLSKNTKKYDRKSSTSSFEIDLNRVSIQEPKFSDDEYNNVNNWSINTKLRRSPEGGEDSTCIPAQNQEPININSHHNIVIENAKEETSVDGGDDGKKHKKKKSKEKKEKGEKTSKDSKEKKKKKSSSKSSKSAEMDFEEFLNGRSTPNSNDAYESI